jgi:hypothetical protein
MSNCDILKFEGNIVDLDNLFNPLSYLEVREAKTNHLLGYLSLCHHFIDNPTVKIPLRKTSHYGVKFDFEDTFPTCCHAKYREFQVRTAFDYRGYPIFKYLEADFNDWKDVVNDRKDQIATEYKSIKGVIYMRLER